MDEVHAKGRLEAHLQGLPLLHRTGHPAFHLLSGRGVRAQQGAHTAMARAG